MSDLSAAAPKCLSIPAVTRFELGDWDATARSMAAGARLDFGQPWLPEIEPDFAPGEVWLGVSGDDLIVYGVLKDDQPANRATNWNERTWLTGDALEFFFQAEERPGYYEFHVTPEDCRLQLFFPSRAAFAERGPLQRLMIAESRFESATRVNATRTGWEAIMRVKLPLVLDEPREDGSRRFRFLLSRYDYQPGRVRPVMSAATNALNAPNFHDVDRWTWAEAARG